jgi:hypothetical protein
MVAKFPRQQILLSELLNQDGRYRAMAPIAYDINCAKCLRWEVRGFTRRMMAKEVE